MTFAAFSTILAVFENIISCCMDLFHWNRKKHALLNLITITVLSLPCVFGYNLWSAFQPLGEGSAVLDLEDFIVSNIILPVGSLCYLLFCVTRYGWGFDKYIEEANTGDGLKLPRWIRVYVTYILPVAFIIFNYKRGGFLFVCFLVLEYLLVSQLRGEDILLGYTEGREIFTCSNHIILRTFWCVCVCTHSFGDYKV